jgi:hypothetical protein
MQELHVLTGRAADRVPSTQDVHARFPRMQRVHEHARLVAWAVAVDP